MMAGRGDELQRPAALACGIFEKYSARPTMTAMPEALSMAP